jgi:hypothetical protein
LQHAASAQLDHYDVVEHAESDAGRVLHEAIALIKDTCLWPPQQARACANNQEHYSQECRHNQLQACAGYNGTCQELAAISLGQFLGAVDHTAAKWQSC